MSTLKIGAKHLLALAMVALFVAVPIFASLEPAGITGGPPYAITGLERKPETVRARSVAAEVSGRPAMPSLLSGRNYTVTFKESGLPSGTTWFVSDSGNTGYAKSPESIHFGLPNGSYSFTATNLSSYYTPSYQFSVRVDGNNLSETVTFHRWAHITGFLYPVNATLAINGQTALTASSGAFNTSLGGGKYHIVAHENGYRTYYKNLTIEPGTIIALKITLQKNSSAPNQGGDTTVLSLSPAHTYLIIAGVAAGIVGISLVALRKRR